MWLEADIWRMRTKRGREHDQMIRAGSPTRFRLQPVPVHQNPIHAEVMAQRGRSWYRERRMEPLWREEPRKSFWAPEEGKGVAAPALSSSAGQLYLLQLSSWSGSCSFQHKPLTLSSMEWVSVPYNCMPTDSNRMSNRTFSEYRKRCVSVLSNTVAATHIWPLSSQSTWDRLLHSTSS